MSHIKVEFAKLKEIGQTCSNATLQIKRAEYDFRSAVRNIDWEIKSKYNITGRVEHVARRLEKIGNALQSYKPYIDTAYAKYSALENYQNDIKNIGDVTLYSSNTIDSAPIVPASSNDGDESVKRYGIKDVIKSFGNVGKVVGLVDNAFSAKTWYQWAGVALSGCKVVSKIAKDFKGYKNIGRAIGTKSAACNFFKKQLGLTSVGSASTASNPLSRFYNNLHMKTSPYNLKGAFSPLTGAKGVKATVIAWAGVALSGVTNAYSNIEEQKNSNGSMSTGRVVAETISETAIDTIVSYGTAAVVGAAIATATGVVAAPVVVALVTGVALATVNSVFEAGTGKSATEFVSDFVLDTAINVGKGVSNGAKAVCNWFNKIVFA